MIDENFNALLIEANINPCLGVTSPFSARFIPALVDNTLRIALDPLFQPPMEYGSSKKNVGDIFPEIKYELFFDQRMEIAKLESLRDNKKSSEDAVICILSVKIIKIS